MESAALHQGAARNPDGLPPERRSKWEAVWEGTDRAYELAAKYKVPVGFGTDFLFIPAEAELQNKWLAAMGRWYTPAQSAKAATSDNAFILGMSGPRNPYAEGKLGVIEKGAYKRSNFCETDTKGASPPPRGEGQGGTFGIALGAVAFGRCPKRGLWVACYSPSNAGRSAMS